MADGCFLLLCGIPGSGKSTLAKNLIQKDWKIAGKCVHFVYINYDDFIPENLPVDGISLAAKWKTRRSDVINGLHKLLQGKTGIDLEDMSEILDEKNTFVSCWCSCGVHRLIRSPDILHVMVIDDNMYYRSMRYEYYQLARKISFSFAEIYLHCPVDVALTRNAQRSSRVSEDTITKMFQRIERPDSGKFNWERFSLTIETSNSPNALDTWTSIMLLLEEATIVPASPIKVSDDLQKAKDRAVTEKSIVHRADQILRKHISQKLEDLKKKSHPIDTLKKEARILNDQRKKVIEEIKIEPKQITAHIFSRRFNIFSTEAQSKDNSAKTALNEDKESRRTVDDGNSVLESSCGILSFNNFEDSNSFSMDESFLCETFWDIVSPEEFAGIVRAIFEKI